MIIAVSCLLILAGFFCSGVHAQIADTSGFSHMQSALLPVYTGLTVPLSSLPVAMYDEQLGLTFTQNFVSLAYNVTAVPQVDSDGYGPVYLLNGLSNDGYWYQVGLSYNWPYAIGGYNPGFNLNYEVFNSAGKSIYPTNGGGGLKPFSGTVNSGDLVLLNLYFNSGNVYMFAKDWNTGASAYVTYADSQTSSFSGSLSSPSNNGLFSGLMTEWWHVNPYTGDETQVTYSDYSLGLSSAWMWMDETAPSNPSWSGAWSTSTAGPVTYSSSNPTQLQSLSSHGATEYSSAYQFITGSIVQQMTSITLLPAGGSTALSASNEFAVSFTLDGQPQVSYAQNGTLTFAADNGTNVVISEVSTGSSSTEEWVLNSQGTNVTVSAGSTTTFYYYDILSQQVAYAVSGGGNPTSPILTYYTAPSTSSSQFNQAINTISLPGLFQQTIMVLRGTIATVSNNILGISQDQWATPTSSWSISQVNQIPSLIVYYHQYQVIASYSTSDGSAPSSYVTLSGTQCGSNYQLPLTTTNQAVWLDANTLWSTPAIATAISGTERWSSSAGISGNVTGAITINPIYVHQYYLTVISNYATPSGSGWYNSGVTAYTGLSSGTVSGGTGTQYVFNNWTGGASGSNYVQSNGITMNAPLTATASWITQYYLTVNSAYGTPAGQGWYNSGTSASLNIPSPVGNAGIQHVFSSWSGSGSGSYNGTSASSSLTMDAPITETASWTTQYYLTVNSSYGTPSGSGWYNAGSDVTFSASPPVPESIITQHVCTGWTGTGSAPATGTNSNLHFTINQPSSITWNWQNQFIWSRVSLIIGVPLVAAIIGLSIYLRRNNQKVQKAENEA